MEKKQELIHELEDQVKQLEQRLDEVRRERDEANALVAEQREWLEDKQVLIENWIEGFSMEVNDNGEIDWPEFIKERESLEENYLALRTKWNKFVADYNAVVAPKRRNFGRPLQASEAQRANVLKLRQSGWSFRSIADETNLSFRTVRTIIDKKDGVDRATLVRLERIAPDRIAEAYANARRKTRKYLPARIAALEERAAILAKKAKGLR